MFAQNNDPFSLPPEVIFLLDKTDSHSLKNRKFTGIPSLAISDERKMWVVWYAGTTPDEDKNNYVVVSVSKDKGNGWEEKIIIDPKAEPWQYADSNLNHRNGLYFE